jgi:hypothetical protein
MILVGSFNRSPYALRPRLLVSYFLLTHSFPISLININLPSSEVVDKKEMVTVIRIAQRRIRENCQSKMK